MCWRQVLKVHPEAERFPRISDDERTALAADIQRNGLINGPVLLEGEDGAPPQLLDGIGRLDAMELACLPVLNESGTWLHPDLAAQCTLVSGVDPHEYVNSLNFHRRHLTSEQKRKLTGASVKASPEKSNRQIARQVNVDDKTVASVRRQLEERAEIPHVSTRQDTKGRRQPAKKARSATPSYAQVKQGELPFTYAEPNSQEVAEDLAAKARPKQRKKGLADEVRDALVKLDQGRVVEIFLDYLRARAEKASAADREALFESVEDGLHELRRDRQLDLEF